MVVSDKDFWGWQSPAGTSPEQPQIATMKEKPSHHPKRESRALQTRCGGTEERSIKYESDPRRVNFISVLPLIHKESGNGRDIIGKISMPAFPIIYPIVKSTYGYKFIDVFSWRRIKLLSCRDSSDQSQSGNLSFAFTTSLEMKLLWLSKCCPIGVNLVSMDRGHIGLHYDRRDLKVNESSGVALLESSRSIWRFLRFLHNPWQRGSETSGLAMLQVRACGAETFVPWTLLERAGIQKQTVLATASCVFMLELNFHSGSSIYSNETDEQE
ncbi:hypothetical protein DY000_02021717 [Brassica cretica]|uniref:Uncharacterized protein n=1 Tax=Brassica cretica TaxID=69181 RepID=A0ABQ7EC12_BRACR|nr:hypothetical protein DY000_02021717 [Brassica cretica]